MRAPSQQGTGASNEAAYRRGFIEGADNAVTGVRRRLTEDDLRKIWAWMKALSKWRAPGPGSGSGPRIPAVGFASQRQLATMRCEAWMKKSPAGAGLSDIGIRGSHDPRVIHATDTCEREQWRGHSAGSVPATRSAC